jgi:NAD(P)H dehydrogenase (quinone)
MRVLTVYAHPNPRSFCHAVLDEFTRGLREVGHTPDVLDLYAMKFDPVFTSADMATWLHPDIPPDILEAMNPRQAVLDGVQGPLRRLLARRAMRGKDNRAIARMIREHGPKDTARHWQHVENADAMAFIAPVFWLAFPAILKGWFERVFSYGNAFALDRSGWEGNVSGRIGLLHHEKALVITPTLFSQEDYEADWQEPMTRIIDDWGLRYPGVKQVEHVYFYRAAVADEATIRDYLERSYELGRDFAPRPPNAPAAPRQGVASDG